MKTIERLRKLEAKATPIWGVPSTVRETDPARGKTHIFHAKTIGEVVVTFADEATGTQYIEMRRIFPALLAAVEAAAKLRAAMNPVDDDGTRKRYVLQPLIDAGKELDAALRALEGGA